MVTFCATSGGCGCDSPGLNRAHVPHTGGFGGFGATGGSVNGFLALSE